MSGPIGQLWWFLNMSIGRFLLWWVCHSRGALDLKPGIIAYYRLFQLKTWPDGFASKQVNIVNLHSLDSYHFLYSIAIQWWGDPWPNFCRPVTHPHLTRTREADRRDAHPGSRRSCAGAAAAGVADPAGSYARNMQFWWAVMGQNCQLWMYNYQLLYIQIIRHTLKLRPWSYKRGQWGEILHFEQGHSPLTSSFRDGFHGSDTTNPHHQAEWCEGEWMSDVIKPCKPNAIAIPMPFFHSAVRGNCRVQNPLVPMARSFNLSALFSEQLDAPQLCGLEILGWLGASGNSSLASCSKGYRLRVATLLWHMLWSNTRQDVVEL